MTISLELERKLTSIFWNIQASTVCKSNSGGTATKDDGSFKYIVYKQPLSLDRFYVHDVQQVDAQCKSHFRLLCQVSKDRVLTIYSNTAIGLKHLFLLIVMNRFQQISNVHSFSAPNDDIKVSLSKRLMIYWGQIELTFLLSKSANLPVQDKEDRREMEGGAAEQNNRGNCYADSATIDCKHQYQGIPEELRCSRKFKAKPRHRGGKFGKTTGSGNVLFVQRKRHHNSVGGATKPPANWTHCYERLNRIRPLEAIESCWLKVVVSGMKSK